MPKVKPSPDKESEPFITILRQMGQDIAELQAEIIYLNDAVKKLKESKP